SVAPALGTDAPPGALLALHKRHERGNAREILAHYLLVLEGDTELLLDVIDQLLEGERVAGLRGQGIAPLERLVQQLTHDEAPDAASRHPRTGHGACPMSLSRASSAPCSSAGSSLRPKLHCPATVTRSKRSRPGPEAGGVWCCTTRPFSPSRFASSECTEEASDGPGRRNASGTG